MSKIFKKNLSLPKYDESSPFFVNSNGIVFVFGHKRLKIVIKGHNKWISNGSNESN